MLSLLSSNCILVESLLHIISPLLSYSCWDHYSPCCVFLCELVLPFLCVPKFLCWFTCRTLALSLLLLYSVLLSRGLCVAVVLKLFWGNVVAYGHMLWKSFYCVVTFWHTWYCWEDCRVVRTWVVCVVIIDICTCGVTRRSIYVGLRMWQDKVRILLCACGETRRAFTLLLRTWRDKVGYVGEWFVITCDGLGALLLLIFV